MRLPADFACNEFVVVSFGSEAAWMPSVLETVELEASARIALSDAGSTVEQLIHDADLAMYRAKELVRRPTW